MPNPCLNLRRPVESGTRITISYKLYASVPEDPSPSFATSSLAFHQALAAALAQPSFAPESRALGFACQFHYAHTSESFSKLMLKAPDAVIAAAAESLGLVVSIVPVWCVLGPSVYFRV